MKKILLLFLAVGIAATSTSQHVQAQFFKKKKTESIEKDSTNTSSRETKYDKLFKGKKHTTAKSDFITIHKFEGGKLYIEFPVKHLGREMMLASTVSEVSDPNYAAIGYKVKTPVHFKFEMGDSTILMKQINTDFTYNKKESNLEASMKLTTLDPIINSFKITATTDDNSAIVFDVTSLFGTNNAMLAPMEPSNSGSYTITPTFNSAGSYIEGIKVFEDNASIKSVMNYTLSISLLGLQTVASGIPFTLTTTRTILLLPEEKMRPRIADVRLGVFLHGKYHISTEHDRIKQYSVTHRWNLIPKDMDAYKRGELSEPVKPIIFYLDPTFPDLWKEPVRKGALRWNSAFENIGFKNAIKVEDFPTPEQDPEFDPDNLKYSCIRYIPNTVSNAMGPSWVDPNSGEIINASVLIFNDVIKLINQWRFIQTAQVDPRVRNKKMPDDVICESLEYIIAHEVGHTLGFMHNMSASNAIPVDSLRSPSFTKKFGTTASIMDYARFNYVAQPNDKNVALTPPGMGVYDYFLVKWLYQPIDVPTYWDEVPILEKWLDEKAGDPWYRYGRQQISVRYDPSAIEEDLGDDPIKAGNYGIANLKYINSHINDWIKGDDDYDFRKMSYENIGNQFYRYVRNVMYNIGGIRLTAVKDGTAGKSVVAVSRKVQKESLKWCVKQIRDCDWLENPALKNNMGLRVELPSLMQYYAGQDLVTSWQYIPISSHVSDDPYTLEEYCDDMYNLIWESTLNNRKLTQAEKTLQSHYVTAMVKASALEWSTVKVSTNLTDNIFIGAMPSVDEIYTYGLASERLDPAHREMLRDIDEKYGKGFVASRLLGDSNIGEDYGMQYKINQRTVNYAREVFTGISMRTKKMLEGRIASANSADKAHYQTLLLTIKNSLDKTEK